MIFYCLGFFTLSEIIYDSISLYRRRVLSDAKLEEIECSVYQKRY